MSDNRYLMSEIPDVRCQMPAKKTRSAMLRLILIAVVWYLLSGISGYTFFEDLEIGPKATALAGTLVSQPVDMSVIFYNPAGLSGLKRPEILTSYERMYWALSDNSFIGKKLLSLGYPINIKGRYLGNIGYAWYVYSVDGFYREDTMKFGYSFPIEQKIYAGLSISNFRVNYGKTKYTVINPVFDSGYSSSAFGVDAGIIYVGNIVNLGISVMNINEPDVGLKYENKIPRKINAGLTIKKSILNLNIATAIYNNRYKFKTGVETWLFSRKMAFRGGFDLGSLNYRNAVLGLGFRTRFYEIDYSFNYPLSGIANTYGSHQLSMIFRWGKAEDEERFSWKDLMNMLTMENRLEKESIKEKEKEEEEKHYSEQQAEARELITQAKNYFVQGLYIEALTTIKKAARFLEDNREVEKLLRRLVILVSIVQKIEDKYKDNRILLKGINAYILGRGRASLNRIRYVSETMPGDSLIKKLIAIIKKEFPKIMKKDKYIEGIPLVQQNLQRTLELIYAGRYIGAITVCEDILDLEPSNVLALERMGSAYWAMGYADKAKDLWRRAVKINPDNPDLKKFLKMEIKGPVKKTIPTRKTGALKKRIPVKKAEPIRKTKPVHLKIDSDPAQAKVFINGYYKGKTPIEIELTSAGDKANYRLTLIKLDYVKWIKEVELQPGDSKDYNITLEKKE